MQPLIGITPSLSHDALAHGTFDRFVLSATYVNAVLAAGGIPLALPPQAGNAAEILDALDGLLFSGGADVEPALFGDTDVHPTTYGISPLRDRFELDLIADARRRDLPVLGICRGIQVLNVAFGGTLIQDIADQHGTAVQHRQHGAGLKDHDVGHDVTLTPGTPVARLYDGSSTIDVNSFHHQAVREVASGLVAAGTAPDGIVEAAFAPDQTFCIGVQWHPEMMFEHHPAQLAPFRGLVAAATAYRLRSQGLDRAPVLGRKAGR